MNITFETKETWITENISKWILADDVEPITRKQLISLKESLDKNGKQKVRYSFAKGREDGREFAHQTCMQNVPNFIKRTCKAEGIFDWDMKNCHPAILEQLCQERGIECELLSRYVNRRDDVFDDFEKKRNR